MQAQGATAYNVECGYDEIVVHVYKVAKVFPANAFMQMLRMIL